MRIESITGHSLSLPFVQPLVTSKATYRRRRTLLVVCTLVEDGGERTWRGFGEAAPLADWTDEDVDDCQQVLEPLEEPASPLEIDDLEELFDDGLQLPSLRFGLQGAVIDGLARLRGIPLRDFLATIGDAPDTPPPSIEIQTVIGDGDVDETRRATRAAIVGGSTAFKIKVGNAPVDADIERVAAVRNLDATATIRIDANGAWSPDQAKRALEKLRPLDIDLVEQPVGTDSRRELLELARQSELDIAADESCSSLAAGRRLVDDGIDALAIKPGALGGLLEVRELVEYATDRGVRVVLSSLIESAVGRHTVAHLAASCGLDGPHGLGTGTWLACDVSRDGDTVADGRLHLSGRPGLGIVPRRPPQFSTTGAS